MLGHIRVLDLTDEASLLGSQVLADLGADTVAVEPLAGSPARGFGPFIGDTRDPERSLFWWAYSRNKRSLALDVQTDRGKDIVLRLLRQSDVLFESRPQSLLPSLGLDVHAIARYCPHLVHVTISPYGLSGPKSDYASSDLTLLAAGGVLALTGDEDRPPIRLSLPQAYMHANLDAAVGALVALHARRASGQGRHVDVSVQQSAAMATQSYILATPNQSRQIQRMSGGFNLGAVRVPAVWPVLDGFVSLTVLFGKGFAPFTSRLFEYLVESGACDDTVLKKDWETYGQDLLTGSASIEEYQALLQLVAEFVSTRTKSELFEQAIERRLLLAPIATASDVLASPHLLAREYWVHHEHPEWGVSVPYPGPFAKFSSSPIAYRLRPPRVGEHSREILAELGVAACEMSDLEASGVIGA